jgi:nicotinamidase-related amidase
MSKFNPLSASDCALLLIDFQLNLLAKVSSMPPDHLKNNVLGLAHAAKAAEVPILLFSSGVDGANGPVLPELLSVVGGTPPYHRSTVNLWADEGCRAAIKGLRRRQLVLAAVMTDSHLVSPSISLMRNGFEVYTVMDASGTWSPQVDLIAALRLMQAGVVPINWTAVVAELKEDDARPLAPVLNQILGTHTGIYGGGMYLGGVPHSY